MWSPFQHSYSFLSGQYQGRCQAGGGFTSFWFLHCLGGDLLRVCCPLTSHPFKRLKLQVQVNTSLWDRERLAQQLCFCSTFFFLLSTLSAQGPLASLLSQGGLAGSFSWTSLPRMCLEGASPVKPMVAMPGYIWNFIPELLMARQLQSLCQGCFPAMVCPISGALCRTPFIKFIFRLLSRAFLLLIATRWGGNYSWISSHSLLFLNFSFAGPCCPFG